MITGCFATFLTALVIASAEDGTCPKAEDALEMIMVGASAVAVGTANFNDPYTTIKVIDGIREYMEKNNVADIKELIGCVR